MSKQETFTSNVQAALEYADQGWHVFPARIVDGSKRSCVAGKANGGERWGATRNPQKIQNYWSRWPDALLGVATGSNSGFFVVDADTLDGHGNDGVGTLHRWIDENGGLPHTVQATTPSGGWHLYFRLPTALEIRNSASKLAPGIDIRGEKGMVIVPPSCKPGSSFPYCWANPPATTELADCPEWLLDKLRAFQHPSHGQPVGAGRPLVDGSDSNEKYNLSLVEEISRLKKAQNGERNDALNCASFKLGQIVAEGGLNEAIARSHLTTAASEIGLDLSEIGSTIESGLLAGIQKPRRITPSEIDLSHDALADDLGKREFDRDARHVAKWGKWLFWSGTRWQLSEKLEHMTRTRNYLRVRSEEVIHWAASKVEVEGTEKKNAPDRLLKWAKDQARSLRNKNTVAAVEALAQSNPASAARSDDFDENRLLLGTPGGTVDLATGQLREACREDMLTKLTACSPAAPGSRPARWLTFLQETFDHDHELIAFMQRAAGYALTGMTSEHKLLFFYGTGRNGKSVFLNTLFDLWGDYARRAAAETFLNTQGDKHATGLAGLQGARLVVGSELPVGKTWDESTIKDLTGGDVITARYMRGDFFDYIPQLTLMIAGNNQPSFRGVDEAIRSRVVMVPFNMTIPPEKRDRNLSEKLMAEGPEILRWAIDGALHWRERGLDVPAKVAEASNEYMDEEDTLGQFLRDETVTDPNGFETSAKLHVYFRLWCQRQGLREWTQRTLSKELKSRGFLADRQSGDRGFTGLKMRK